jgi:hypothetical protein
MNNSDGCGDCLGGCLFFFFLMICIPMMIWVLELSLFIVIPITIGSIILKILFNICRPSRKTN